MNRRDFLKKTAGTAGAAAMISRAGFVQTPVELENAFDKGETSTLYSSSKVSNRAREMAQKDQKIRDMIEQDIARSARQALDHDAGITIHDRVICHDLELDIDEWMAGKRRARELGVLPETVYPELEEETYGEVPS